MPKWVIQHLDRTHDRTQFDCGESSLNDWLQQLASQNEKRNLVRTYVALHGDDKRVWGYYALLNHRVKWESLPPSAAQGLPRIDAPVVLLGRLAVDRSVQGQGLGEILLIDALGRARYIADQIGVRAVEVDAIDDNARAFYLRYGFISLLDDPRHLYLPMPDIRKLDLPPL